MKQEYGLIKEEEIVSMKHYCGGNVIYRPEESCWFCRRCGESFDSIESVHTSNLVAEHSDEEDDLEGV